MLISQEQNREEAVAAAAAAVAQLKASSGRHVALFTTRSILHAIRTTGNRGQRISHRRRKKQLRSRASSMTSTPSMRPRDINQLPESLKLLNTYKLCNVLETKHQKKKEKKVEKERQRR